VPAAQFAIRPPSLEAVTGFVSAYVVFAALPLLAGKYVAQQRRAADQERLRIADDMHDSLGRRLSLAALQAAALEVAELPPPQHAAIARLATSVRASVTELHEILGGLRGAGTPSQGMAAVAGLVEEFRTAGAPVSVQSRGRPWPLPPQADEAAYRIIEEGLTNAIRHAPGQPISVTVAWEASALLLTVVNAADRRPYAPGSGLAGLGGRLQQVGGVLDHEQSGGLFRLRAVLPASPAHGARERSGVSGLGLAAAIMLLVILPAVVLLGVR